MTGSSLYLSSDTAWPLWDDLPLDGAFQLDLPTNRLENAVVLSVKRPWLFGYRPQSTVKPNGRAILVLGGGGYTQLMVGREGITVALWLTSLGFHAFVLVHRFPTATTGPQAPFDDAQKALVMIEKAGRIKSGLGICGLSSGGHLAAALLAKYPAQWPAASFTTPNPEFAIIGYGPISTNAVGRTIIASKAALEPPAKQELYNILQPDVQLMSPAPPVFIVYSGNDPVVPVVNAYRLGQAVAEAGGAVELHIFADAPHGFALDTKDLPVGQWPSMCEAWMKQNEFC